MSQLFKLVKLISSFEIVLRKVLFRLLCLKLMSLMIALKRKAGDLFPRDTGLQRKLFIREFVQNKAEICEDELRLAEIQLSFSDTIFSKFYCARQELLAALDYSLISGSVKNLKIIFSTIFLYNCT